MSLKVKEQVFREEKANTDKSLRQMTLTLQNQISTLDKKQTLIKTRSPSPISNLSADKSNGFRSPFERRLAGYMESMINRGSKSTLTNYRDRTPPSRLRSISPTNVNIERQIPQTLRDLKVIFACHENLSKSYDTFQMASQQRDKYSHDLTRQIERVLQQQTFYFCQRDQTNGVKSVES